MKQILQKILKKFYLLIWASDPELILIANIIIFVFLTMVYALAWLLFILLLIYTNNILIIGIILSCNLILNIYTVFSIFFTY